MSQHVEERLTDYIQGLFSDEERLSANAHLEACEPCRSKLEWIQDFRATAREAGLHHIAPERIVEVADGASFAVGEHEHLATCTECQTDLNWARQHSQGSPEMVGSTSRSMAVSPVRRFFRAPVLWSAGLATAALFVVFLLTHERHVDQRVIELARAEALPASLTRGTGDPGSFEALRATGMNSYAEARYTDALPQFQSALELRPDDALSLLYAGSAHILTGQADQAAPLLEHLLAGDAAASLRKEGRWLLVQVRLHQARADEALHLLEDVKQVPDRYSAEAQELRQQLQLLLEN